MKKFLLFGLALLTGGVLSAAELLVQLSGDRDGVVFSRYSASPELQIRTRPDKKRPRNLRFSCAAADAWKKYEIRFTPKEFGAVELLLSSGLDKTAPHWVLFDDFQMQGAVLQNPGLESLSGGVFEFWRSRPENLFREGACKGNISAGVIPAAPLRQFITVAPHREVVLRFQAKTGPAAPLRLEGTGRYPWIEPLAQNPHPVIPFVKASRTPAPQKKEFEVRMQIVGNTVRRTWPLRFGMPLPQGEFTDVRSLHVLNRNGKVLPSQIVPLSFWPDRSVKVALIQFQAPLSARPEYNYMISGKAPAEKSVSYPKLSLREEEDRFVVSSGDLRAAVSKYRFSFLSGVWYKNQYLGRFADRGFEFRDEERGIPSTPESEKPLVSVEEYGPMTLTLRADGFIGSAEQPQFRYTARLRFFAGSPLVEMRWTLYSAQNWIRRYSSLNLDFFPSAVPTKLRMEKSEGRHFFQQDDRKLLCDGKELEQKLSGGGRLVFGKNELTFALCNAWQRYPKGFRIGEQCLSFELLPRLPNENFGNGLPAAMRFPFDEGLYRLRAGNSISETLWIDFSGKSAPEALAAEAPLVLWPQKYLARTEVFPSGIARQKVWDAAASRAVGKLLAERREMRAYGFWNYGDFLTHDQKAWNNNSFDLTHGLYQHFLRTGTPETGFAARKAAAHTAAVDTLHYGRDPAYCGLQSAAFPPLPGNRTFPHFPEQSEYDSRSFTKGLTDAWLLEGDCEAMDAALLTGENLLRYAVPLFIPEKEETKGSCIIESLLPLYEATGDKRYLQGAGVVARRIAAARKKEFGGAWPYTLGAPDRNAAGKDSVFGADTRHTGLLLLALHDYGKMSGDPEIRSLEEPAVRWLLRGFQSEQSCWPDTMSWDNFPCRSSGCSRSAATAAAAALIPEGRDAARQNSDRLAALGMPDSVPELAESLLFQPRLQSFFPEKRSASPQSALLRLRRIATGFRVCAASGLRYRIVLTAPKAQLRLIFHARPDLPRGVKPFSVQLKKESGKTLWKRTVPPYRTMFCDISLAGQGEKFVLEINGAAPGFWQLEPGKGFSAVLKMQKDLRFAPGGARIPLRQQPDTAAELRLSAPAGRVSAGICLSVSAPKPSVKLVDSRIRESFAPEKTLVLHSPADSVPERDLLVFSDTPFALNGSGFYPELPVR